MKGHRCRDTDPGSLGGAARSPGPGVSNCKWPCMFTPVGHTDVTFFVEIYGNTALDVRRVGQLCL